MNDTDRQRIADAILHPAPQKVQIVRPRRDRSEGVAAVLGEIANWFLSAWVLMLLIPVFASWHPSYWQALAFFVAARVVLQVDTSWLRWTSAPRKAPQKRAA